MVTGGSRGIGFAIAHALAAQGVKVAITGLSESHLADARQKLERLSPNGVETKRADVRSYTDVEQAIASAVRRFGGLDILINNAGVGVFTTVAEMTPVQWADVIETNLTGVFNACHVALPHLRRRGGGFIINISSSYGWQEPFCGRRRMRASKVALNAFSEALMQEVRRWNSCELRHAGIGATGFGGGDPSKGDEWKIAPDEVAELVVNLLRHDARSLPSRVELRPSKPPRK